MEKRFVSFATVLAFLLISVGSAQAADFTDVAERLAALESQGQRLTTSLAAQEKRHSEEMAEQKTLIQKLQTLVDQQTLKIATLEADMQATQARSGLTSSDDVVPPVDGVPKMSKTMQGARMRSSRMLYEGPVAFQAEVTNASVTHINVGQKIAFSTVTLNLGGGYNPQTGIFVAPMAGIYIFSTSLMSYYKPHNEIWVRIVKNGQKIAGAFAYGDVSRDQGSVTVATQLAVGDQVWVRMDGLADDSLWGDGFTSFMGCMTMYS